MTGVEFFRTSIIETCRSEFLEEYRYIQRGIQKAIRATLEPSQYGQYDPTSGLGSALIHLNELPQSVQNRFDPQNPLVIAGMLIGAVSLRAWVYRSEVDGYKNTGYEEIWKGTKLHKLSATCEEAVAEIVPKTHGKFVAIETKAMHTEHRNALHSGTREHIVLSGLNAAGKSKLIKFFSEFLKTCDINVKIAKMPRPDGPLSEVIGSALRHGLKIKGDALQLAFLSDALDFDPEPDALMVFDRHPLTDALVYGPERITRLVLSAREVVNDIYQTFIIDQHPMACALKVKGREVSPRIFENEVEKMVEQLIRFASLTVLPGVHWINNDIPVRDSDPTNLNIQTSIERFVGCVFFSGVLQRYLLKEGKFNSYSQASDFIYQKWLDYFESHPATFY